jgi:Zn finger protein HypA/HybF involved in hydrogenase expression
MGVKLTTEEVIRRVKNTHGDTYDLSKFVYTTQRTKSIFICKLHGEFLSQPKEVWGGTGCPECGVEKFVKPLSKWEDVKQRILMKHGDDYEFVVESYNGVAKKMKVFCKIHQHEWSTRPMDLIKGYGCPKCSYVKSGDKLRMTLDEFIKRSRDIHGSKYDYSKVDRFRSQRDDITIICPTHGEFPQNIRSHFTGSGCPKCNFLLTGERFLLSWEDVILSFRKTHGEKYEYNQNDYINSSSKLRITCSKHGQFLQDVTSHKQGQGCPQCGRERISESLKTPWDVVLKSFIETHRNEYSYNSESYTLLESPMEMFCKKHGKFEQSPKSHRIGSGCPICNSSRGEKEIQFLLSDFGIVYVHQKKFPELSNYFRYDFYVPIINTVIEYNGLQHYEPVDHFDGQVGFEKTIERDRIKKEHCVENGINYEIIRYDEDINCRILEILSKYGLPR